MFASLPILLVAALWGQSGHRVVARVALDFLTPAAHAAALDLLGSDSAFVTASTWADEIRAVLPETAPWHYVNVPIDSAGYDRARDCPTGDCVIEVIEWFRRVLADSAAPRAARVDALRYLIHFVADLHQPLHVANRDDRGGNDVPVVFRGRTTNLHAVWDSGLSSVAGHGGDDALLAAVAQRAAAIPAPTVEVERWADESHELARDRAYRIERGGRIGDGYTQAGVEIVLDRLALAGRRLARLLDVTLDPLATPTPR